MAERNYRKKTSLLSWNNPSDFGPPWQRAVCSPRRREPDGSHISNGCISTWQTPSWRLAVSAGSFLAVCEGSKWLREHQHFLVFIYSILCFWVFFFFKSYPKLVQNGKNPPSKGCTSDIQAASAPSWRWWWCDSGLMPFSSSHQMDSLQMYRAGPKDKLSTKTMSLAGWLTFCIHTKSEKSSRTQPEVSPAGP